MFERQPVGDRRRMLLRHLLGPTQVVRGALPATAGATALPHDSTVVDALAAPVKPPPVSADRSPSMPICRFPLYQVPRFADPRGRVAMNTRVYTTIRWLQRSGSLPLLVTIVASALVSVALIDDGGAARPVTIVSMAVLGIALVLGCLFAFPYAGIWHDDHHAGSA